MDAIIFLIGLALIFYILFDAFETVVLPRRVSSRFRLTSAVRRNLWSLWLLPVRGLPPSHRKEDYLSIFGPLSLLVLFFIWVVALIFGFSLLLLALNSPFNATDKAINFGTDLYASGSTFFTAVGIAPRTPAAQALVVGEVGVGFAFLALVIGYIPAVYQAFAEREVQITLMDARAGSPPTAFELLRRSGQEDLERGATDASDVIKDFLTSGENWTAELLETHLSYPLLAFYRSQHESQSWLAALAAILDASALASVGIAGIPRVTGRLSFAMARHCLVDLAQVYRTPPHSSSDQRLTPVDFEHMRSELEKAGISLDGRGDFYQSLSEQRELYEPYLASLSSYLVIPIPAWMPEEERLDNWQSTAWSGSGAVRL
ncbi:MAG TPA: hypothetical protein VF813_08715 [Anaerolineaceae bacterium]